MSFQELQRIFKDSISLQNSKDTENKDKLCMTFLRQMNGK